MLTVIAVTVVAAIAIAALIAYSALVVGGMADDVMERWHHGEI